MKKLPDAATFLYWCSILVAKYVAPAKSHVSGQLAKYVGELRCGEIVKIFIMSYFEKRSLF